MTFVCSRFRLVHNPKQFTGQLVRHSVNPCCTHALMHSLIYSVLSANTRSAAIENDSIKLPSAGQLQMQIQKELEIQIQIQIEIRIEIEIQIQILPGLQLPAAIMHSATCCCLPHATTATIQSNFRIFLFFCMFSKNFFGKCCTRVLHATSAPTHPNPPWHTQ